MILDTVAEPHYIKCVDFWGGQGVVVAAGQAMGRISFVIFRRFLRRTSQSRHAFDVQPSPQGHHQLSRAISH